MVTIHTVLVHFVYQTFVCLRKGKANEKSRIQRKKTTDKEFFSSRRNKGNEGIYTPIQTIRI